MSWKTVRQCHLAASTTGQRRGQLWARDRDVKSFDQFRKAMSLAVAPMEPPGIAQWVEATVHEACKEAGLTAPEIYCGGPIVTMFLTPRHPWEAVVVGLDAYQLYPGFLRDGGEVIVWPNVWVGDNLTLEKFVAQLEEAVLTAAREQTSP
jgi:hypothetical protein